MEHREEQRTKVEPEAQIKESHQLVEEEQYLLRAGSVGGLYLHGLVGEWERGVVAFLAHVCNPLVRFQRDQLIEVRILLICNNAIFGCRGLDSENVQLFDLVTHYDLLKNAFSSMLDKDKVVKICNDHHGQEVFCDIDDCERLGDDDIVVEARDNHDHDRLQKACGDSQCHKSESPVMVQSEFNLSKTFFEFTHHGDMHHETGDVTGKCDFIRWHWDLTVGYISVLPLDQVKDNELEEPGHQHL